MEYKKEKDCNEKVIVNGLEGALKYAFWIMTIEFGYSQGKLSEEWMMDEKTLAKIKLGEIADRRNHVKGVNKASAEYFLKRTLMKLDEKVKESLAAGRSPGHYYALSANIAKCTYGIPIEMPTKKKWMDEEEVKKGGKKG